jgi:hypothetical protein
VSSRADRIAEANEIAQEAWHLSVQARILLRHVPKEQRQHIQECVIDALEGAAVGCDDLISALEHRHKTVRIQATGNGQASFCTCGAFRPWAKDARGFGARGPWQPKRGA